jgi:cellulose synthase/poly-beta-1,6-N-acetylglucosamine synthase-like glycosyltransferase
VPAIVKQPGTDLVKKTTHSVPTPSREIIFTVICLSASIAIMATLGRHLVNVGTSIWQDRALWPTIRFAMFTFIVTGLAFGILVYLATRLGYHVRLKDAMRNADAAPPAFGEQVSVEPLVILVPSYKEDEITIRQTLMSAALQDYGNRRVVLLLDDPPYPVNTQDKDLIESARRLPVELGELFASPRAEALQALEDFNRRMSTSFDPELELRSFADAVARAERWFVAQANAVSPVDHTARLFKRLVLDDHIDLLNAAVRKLESSQPVSPAIVAQGYRWLVQQFDVEFSLFERKQFVNLSHEANKAANLNSYIGLLGTHVRECRSEDGRHLLPCDPTDPAVVSIPASTYVITLDADSLIAPTYAQRLVSIMERPGNDRLAVAQTPYSAIPGSTSPVERIAGAQTDIQFIVHQGFTWFNATFWVGANALLRKAAVDDIRSVEIERGYRITRFIQDRTVIEDTESSVDLAARGWRLHNEPARLAYSATPPDFGALLIQRRRWANGGLLVFPKLLRYSVSRRWDLKRPVELLMGAHYLTSIALANVALLLMLALPFDSSLNSPWLFALSVPYIAMYGRDLVLCGYRRTDILRVYALNWLLLPVNLAGVLKSIQQGITGEKIPFGRTPKIEGRTAAPAWAVGSLWLLLAYTVSATFWEAIGQRWLNAAFVSSSALAIGYALVVFVGIQNSVADLRAGGVRSSRWLADLRPSRARLQESLD